MTPVPERLRFTDDDMRQILGRAIELDEAWRSTISKDDLASIARELGVSEEAVAKALEERFDSVPPVDTRDESPPLLHTLLLGGSVGAVGPLFRDVLGPSEVMAGLIGLQSVAVLVAAKTGGRYRHAKFQLQNAGLWISYTAGRAIFHPLVAGGIVGIGIEFGSITAIAGGGLIVAKDLLRRLAPTPPTVPSTKLGIPEAPSEPVLRRWRHRIVGWIQQCAASVEFPPSVKAAKASK